MDFKPPDRQVLSKLFNGNQLMIRKFESLYRNDDDLAKIVDDLLVVVNNIIEGSGLEEDGTYEAPTGTNYVDPSTSLADADTLLDTAIAATDSREKIINKSSNYQALEENQLIITDATSGEIEINLPNPINCVIDQVSYKVGITKKDTSLNYVIILPFASELIVGEAVQQLRYEGEVLNFITDGTNWYLGA